MKGVYIFILVLLVESGFCQIGGSILNNMYIGDTICVPVKTILLAAEKIKLQGDTIKYQSALINELMKRDTLYKNLINKQSNELQLLYTRVEIADGILDRYQQYIRKEQWHDKTWIHVGTGFFGALVVSIIVNNIK